jgi:hypothetical protein
MAATEGAVLIHGLADPQKSISDQESGYRSEADHALKTATHGAPRWFAAAQCARHSLRIVSPHCQRNKPKL